MREKRFGRLFLTWLLAATMVLTLLPVGMLAADGEGEATSAGVSGLTVGFKVQMNPRSNKVSSPAKEIYYEGEELEVNLAYFTSAYIKPYIEVNGVEIKAPDRTLWEEHQYYTFEFNDFQNGKLESAGNSFGTETIYNANGLNNQSPTGKIVAEKLADERLYDEENQTDNYYMITVKGYETLSSGEEKPEENRKLVTETAKLHVRMTWETELDWLESYTWDDNRYQGYAIDRDLTKIYSSSELISDYLKNYVMTYGEDEFAVNRLNGIPVSWAVTDGTEYSTAPGAVNSLTWTAELEKAVDSAKWTIPEGFERSRAIQFQNPFAVRFMDGENVLKSILVKKGGSVTEDSYPELPTKPNYTSTWDKTPGFAVEKNTDVHAVYTPISYGITYHLDGGTNSPDNPVTYTVEDTFPLKAPTKQGYAFTGWTSGDETEPKLAVTIPVGTTGRLTFTAHWVEVATITATADEHGKIAPAAGTITVPKGESKTFTITPDSGYHIKDVLVDGKSVGAVSTYTFENVVDNHTIHATFARKHTPTPSTPTVEIPDDDALGLNTTDHFAYIVGYGNGEVRPQNNITRAEVATIFFRLLTDDVRDENLTKTNRYSDVTRADWYNTAVSTLSSMGIITGYPDGTFRPNAAITRAEFAAIAARFDSNGDKTAAKFSDIATHWAKDEISIAYNNGWITGYPNGTFGPQRDITRAEAMTLVNRVLDRQPETEDDLLPNMTVWTDNANPKAWYYLAVQEATNSHYYKFKTNSKYEKWTELRETRDWTLLEK